MVEVALKKAQIEVMLVDDHPIVRQGIKQLLEDQADMQVIGESEDAAGALDLLKKIKPTIVIVDVSLKGRSGVELIKDIQCQYGDIPVLVLSMHNEDLYATRVLRAGARGYLMKEEVPEKLLDAIRKVVKGEIVVSASMASRMLQQAAGGKPFSSGSMVEDLTDRELEVFEMLGRGRTTREIAESLNLSVKTVETHRAHIMEKLGIEHAPALIHRAVEWFHTEREHADS